MRPDEDVDAVDLVETEPLDRAAELAAPDRFRPRRTEALGGKRDPSGLGEGQMIGQRRAPAYA